MKTPALAVLAILIAGHAFSFTADSVVVNEKKHSPLKLSLRLHSRGLFSYGGRLVTSNPVVDFSLNYSGRNWGIQVFKAVDVVDHHTPINFTLAVVNRPFHLGKKLTITPAMGVLLEQYESLADHGSDAAMMLTTSYRINASLSIEHTSLAGNLVLEPTLRDWINRIRLMYSHRHLDVTFFGWHNNGLFDGNAYVAAGASVFISRLKLAGPLTSQVGITGLWMAAASDEQTRKGASGVFASLGFALN